MKRITAVLAAMLFAVNAHATPAIEFGTVTAYNDSVWAVQIIVSGLPDTCDLVCSNTSLPDSNTIRFTGTLQPAYPMVSQNGYGADNVIPGDYWPATQGAMGIAWPGASYYQWVFQSSEVNCQGGDGAGWVGSFLVKGEGTIQLVHSGYNGCEANQPTAVSNTLPLIIGGSECGWCEFATAATAPEDKKPATATKRSTWGSIKSLYR